MEFFNDQKVECMRNIEKKENNMEKVIIAQHKVKSEENNRKKKKEFLVSLHISEKINIEFSLFNFIIIISIYNNSLIYMQLKSTYFSKCY